MRNNVMTVSEVARNAFEPGFYIKGALRPEHRADTQQRLAQALMPSGINAEQVGLLAQAMRDIGDAEEFSPDQPVTQKQRLMVTKIVTDPIAPAFRDIIQAAVPHLTQRRDLYALFGVLSGTQEKMEQMALRHARMPRARA